MNLLKKTALIAILAATTATANANWFQIDVSAFGAPAHNDPDTLTGSFDEFGFSQTLSTSIFDFPNGSLNGSFYDTNIISELNAVGITGPSFTGPTLAGTNATLDHPDFSNMNIDTLDPNIGGITGKDGEGFLQNWELISQFHFDGVFDQSSGPTYTDGFFDLYTSTTGATTPAADKVFSASLTSSSVTGTALKLTFEITEAIDNFLLMSTSEFGVFNDVHDLLANGDSIFMTLFTTVVPAIPTADQLVWVDNGNSVARQTQLNGKLTQVPEPSIIALFGLALLGFSARLRKKV